MTTSRSIDTGAIPTPDPGPSGDDFERTHEVPNGLVWKLRDSWTEALRHLRTIPRDPELLVFVAIQPIMFVLLFAYIFGGSINVPGYASYTQFLIPGIFAQTMVFNSAFTSVGLATDLSKGIIDRLRSLPMWQPSVLVGRTISDTLRNVVSFVVMFVVGYVVGFRIEGTVVQALGATLLLLGFSYAFSWIQALIGMMVHSPEAANSGGFIWMFPLTFVSSAFVATQNLPVVLQKVADVNPFTLLTNAARALYNGRDPGADLWWAIVWAVGITVVFSVLASRKYSRSVVR